jgi:hypothetical protein
MLHEYFFGFLYSCDSTLGMYPVIHVSSSLLLCEEFPQVDGLRFEPLTYLAAVRRVNI